MRFRKP